MIAPELKQTALAAVFKEALGNVRGATPLQSGDVVNWARENASFSCTSTHAGVALSFEVLTVLVINEMYSGYYDNDDMHELKSALTRIQTSFMERTMGSKRIKNLHHDVANNLPPI